MTHDWITNPTMTCDWNRVGNATTATLMEAGIIFGIVLSICSLPLALYTTIVCNILITILFAVATIVAAFVDAEEVFGALVVLLSVETLIVVHQTHDQCRPCLQYFILETTDADCEEDHEGDNCEDHETIVKMVDVIDQVDTSVGDSASANVQESINLKLYAYNEDV